MPRFPFIDQLVQFMHYNIQIGMVTNIRIEYESEIERYTHRTMRAHITSCEGFEPPPDFEIEACFLLLGDCRKWAGTIAVAVSDVSFMTPRYNASFS